MDISHKVPFAEIYARDEYYFKEPVVGVVGAFMRTCKPYIVVANTLGKALKTLELARAVILTPYDGSWEAVKFETGEPPKYFVYATSDGFESLVDVHILRRGEEICPKQDLNFALCDGDIVVPGSLIC